MARSVKGGVRARRESLVVCDFRWVAEAERRGRGRGEGGVAVGGEVEGGGWDAAREVVNWKMRPRVVWRAVVMVVDDGGVEGVGGILRRPRLAGRLRWRVTWKRLADGKVVDG